MHVIRLDNRYLMLTTPQSLCNVLPYMASLISKKKGNKLYYYVVESARVDGKPRIVQQTYLGTADRLADLLKERTRSRSRIGHDPRVRSSGSALVGRSAFWRLGCIEGDVATGAV